MSSVVYMGYAETHAINDFIKDIANSCPESSFTAVPGTTCEVSSVLSSINLMLNDTILYHMINW